MQINRICEFSTYIYIQRFMYLSVECCKNTLHVQKNIRFVYIYIYIYIYIYANAITYIS